MRSTEEIDRQRLRSFEVYATDDAISPSISVGVPKRVVLIARQRTFVTSTGKPIRLALVALETPGRKLLGLWELPEGGITVLHDSYGGPGLWPPVRNEKEVSAA
jgi:hypothetical protein